MLIAQEVEKISSLNIFIIGRRNQFDAQRQLLL
jgi:hypothetical protein